MLMRLTVVGVGVELRMCPTTVHERECECVLGNGLGCPPQGCQLVQLPLAHGPIEHARAHQLVLAAAIRKHRAARVLHIVEQRHL